MWPFLGIYSVCVPFLLAGAVDVSRKVEEASTIRGLRESYGDYDTTLGPLSHHVSFDVHQQNLARYGDQESMPPASLLEGVESEELSEEAKAQALLSGLTLDEFRALDSEGSGGDAECEVKQTAKTGSAMADFASHDVACSAKYYLRRWRLHEEASKVFVNYTCCKLGGDDAVTCSTENSEETTVDAGSAATLGGLEPAVKCDASGKSLNQFKLTITGDKYKFSYKCCPLSGSWGLDECADKKTPLTNMHGGELKQLQYHNPHCNAGQVMKNWNVLVEGTKMRVAYQCCDTKMDLALDPTIYTCSVSGDPHFYTFDYPNHDAHQPKSGKYWIVKSKWIFMQGQYCGTMANPGTATETCYCGHVATTRALMFGGLFMRGHKLIIKDSKRDSTFDGKVASFPIDISNLGDGLKITRSGNNFEAYLPMGFTTKAQQRGPWHGNMYLNYQITMKRLPGGQGGHCGDNDGVVTTYDTKTGIPTHQNNWLVEAADDLMTSPTGVPGKDFKDEDCAADDRAKADKICRAQLKVSSGSGDAFLNICIYDVCLGGSTEFVADAVASQQKYDTTLLTNKPLPWNISDKVKRAELIDGTRGTKLCADDFEPAPIKNAFEQIGVMGATEDVPMGSMILLGGIWNDRDHIFEWNDKSSTNPKCAYENFANLAGWRSGPSEKEEAQALCMSLNSGLWQPCVLTGGNMKPFNYVLACRKPKIYAVFSDVGPVQARTACGTGMMLAMPKSADEQAQILEQVKAEAATDRVWLGGRFVQARGWQWDDGVEICGYTNWATSADLTGVGSDPNIEDFMCMHPTSGDWLNCGSDKTQRYNVACESIYETPQCEQAAFNGTQQGLSENGDEYMVKEQGYCYYFGKGGRNCEETCLEQMGGSCDVWGTQRVADSLIYCRTVVNRFGGFTYKTEPEQTNIKESDVSMCTYYDDLAGDKHITVHRDSGMLFTSCSATPPSDKEHRICACK